ncbi:MAG: hypothetical protein AAGB12_12655 [Pseudomonadota bacterium]
MKTYEEFCHDNEVDPDSLKSQKMYEEYSMNAELIDHLIEEMESPENLQE